MEKNNSYSDEIDIGKYVKIVLKRKKTFLFAFLLTLALGLGICYFLCSTKMCQISMVIQPSFIMESPRKKVYVEPPEALKALIINKALNEEIMRRLELDPAAANFDFMVTVQPDAGLLIIGLTRKKEDRDTGVKILKTLGDVLSEKYDSASLLSYGIDKERGASPDTADLRKNDVLLLEGELREIESQKNEVMDRIKLVDESTYNLFKKRDALFNKNSGVTHNSLLVYSDAIRFNFDYSKQLGTMLDDLKTRANAKREKMEYIKSIIASVQMGGDKLRFQKACLSDLKVLKGPDVILPEHPCKKKGILASIFFAFLAAITAVFLQDFLSKQKRT